MTVNDEIFNFLKEKLNRIGIEEVHKFYHQDKHKNYKKQALIVYLDGELTNSFTKFGDPYSTFRDRLNSEPSERYLITESIKKVQKLYIAIFSSREELEGLLDCFYTVFNTDRFISENVEYIRFEFVKDFIFSASEDNPNFKGLICSIFMNFYYSYNHLDKLDDGYAEDVDVENSEVVLENDC